ncbi:MAG: type II secretion system protein [Phycisphaerales bacterium]|nr:type II secretion system protein [Planctomycetota bacterium]
MKHKSSAGAFTLIELLIAIGIIGVLISLMLPALGKMRITARQTKGMANLRSVATTFAQYAGQYQVYPFIQPGGRIQGPHGEMDVPEGFIGCSWIRPGAMIMSSDPFEMEWMWAAAMSKFIDVETNYPTWVSPGLPERLPDSEDIEPREQISIRLSNAFIARPELFGPNAKDDPKMIAPCKPEDVLSPSSKVMLFDAHVAYYPKRPAVVDSHYDAPTPMAFADGHADAKNPVNAKEGVPNVMRGGSKIKLHSTPNGIRGQDY